MVTVTFLIGSCKEVCPGAGHVVNQEAAANHQLIMVIDLPPAVSQNLIVHTKKDPLTRRENFAVLTELLKRETTM